MIELSARMKVRPGELEGFKQIEAISRSGLSEPGRV